MASHPGRILRRRYLSLGVGELSAAVVFALVAVAATTEVPDRQAAAVWSALTPLLVILLQAGAYWLLARRRIGVGPMPRLTATAYRAFRGLDPVVLAAGLLGVVIWWPGSALVATVVLGVWLFGVLEYVNYFVVRLAYPIRHWGSRVGRWRTPRLVRDLRSASS